MEKTNILLVFGTRPEAIKMCPLIKELKKHDQINTIVCLTAQHREMLDQVMEEFNIKADYDLSIMQKGQTLFDITSRLLDRLKDIYIITKPAIVLVHGDTSSAFVAALAAFYMQIPVGHVEAGLRTNNMYSPYPEEFNRQAIDLITEYYFAPTNLAKNNLLKEGKAPTKIFVTGNTVIDAMQTTIQNNFSDEITKWAEGYKMILLTAHRRENVMGGGVKLLNIFRAVKRITEVYPDVKIVYPMHLNPKVRDLAYSVFGESSDQIKLIEPIDVIKCHNYMNHAYLILTDSGGIQEEAPHLGKPVLVLRDTTERPEGVEAGVLKLVGTNEEDIVENVKLLIENPFEYNKMSKAQNPYGDGHASERIADILLRSLNENR